MRPRRGRTDALLLLRRHADRLTFLAIVAAWFAMAFVVVPQLADWVLANIAEAVTP